jgi:DNA-binding SARP family transcriptional activator/tetratricopeptide (TPR) repeat protein
MRLGVLGPLEARADGHELALGSGRQRAVLVFLVLHAHEIVSKERLIDALWGERRPASAGKVLQGHVSQLRRLLPPETIITRGSGYALRGVDTDAAEFERLLDEARTQEPRDAATTLRAALELWRGPALAEVEDEAWAQTAIARLEELRLVALEERVEADLRLGEGSRLVPELEALVADHPLRERLRAQLMLALYRGGRQPEALEVYANGRRHLVEELGVEPGKPLRDLQQAILRQDPLLDAAAHPKAAVEPARSVFVGRGPELAKLLAGLEHALSGNGRIFLLVGEPGIGKSRLAEEVCRRAEARGVRVLVGRCWEAGGAPAYWPWIQALRTCVREIEPGLLQTQLGARAAELAQILPEVRELLPDLPEPAPLDSEAARFRLFDSFAEFLRTASASRPILLLLDDLHAADAPSLLLLQFVARELASSRVLLICALRDVDPVPAQRVSTMLSELAREPLTQRLLLPGLSEDDVAAFLEVTASGLASPDLVATLHERTEGNPLFLGEIVRLLTIEGDRAGAAIPPSVRDVIGRRLSHLTDECNRLLLLASILGREFAPDVLARLAGISDEELLDTLDEAVASRVVSEVPGSPGRVRFAHVVIRDTLYEGLTTGRRVRLHRRALEALEAIHGADLGPHVAELVHHAIAGSEFDKGVHYARRAGDRAFTLLAYEEAARFFQVALDALELAGMRDEEVRCELLLSLGEAEALSDRRAAQQAFLEAAAVARRRGSSRALAQAALGYGGRDPWQRAGGDARLVSLLEEALEGLPEGEVDLKARLLSRLAGALRDEHARDRRDALSAKAVELARRSGDRVALAYALDSRVGATIAPDTVATCLELASELIGLGEQIGDKRWIVDGYSSRFVPRVMLGDLGAARLDLAAYADLVEELRQPPVELFEFSAHRAMLALAEGRLDEAEDLVEQAFRAGERAQPEMALPAYVLQRYTLAEFRGRVEEVEPAVRDLVARYPARPVFRCALAHLDGRLGRHEEARQALDDMAADDFSALPFDQEWLFGLSLLAETCAGLNATTSAPVLYRLLRPWATFNAADPYEGIRGSVSRYLGLLAMSMGRWSDAAQHFEDAVASNARMGLRPWLAYTQQDYARTLLARDEPGNRERAEKLSDSALATYRALGMQSDAVSAAPSLAVRVKGV